MLLPVKLLLCPIFSLVYRQITKHVIHHEDAGKVKENVIGKRQGLGLIRFAIAIYYPGNTVL